MSSLPTNANENTDNKVREFFDEFYQVKIEYPSAEVDAVLGFFSKRGFDEAATSSIAATLLRQAKTDNVRTFRLLDTLKGLSEVQLSALVVAILNNNRIKSSVLGVRVQSTANLLESRNIVL